MKPYHALLLAVGGLALASCASVKKAGSSLAAFSPNDLMPARVKVRFGNLIDVAEFVLHLQKDVGHEKQLDDRGRIKRDVTLHVAAMGNEILRRRVRALMLMQAQSAPGSGA